MLNPCHVILITVPTFPIHDFFCEAISHGCTGVEADIWHFEDDDTLYVGHDTAHLSSTHTFEDLYVKPILNLLRRRNLVSPRPTKGRRNGIFDQDPFQSLILLVDFKTSGPELLSRVEAQLEPLRANDFLTYYDGSTLVHRPVTIVGTGNAPFNLLTNSSYRDIFFDAPLADLYLPPDTSEPGSSAPQFSSQSQHHSGQGRIGTANVKPSDYDGSNSFYASVSFTASIGYPWFGKLTDYQIELIRGQIRGAHKQGLQARYWSTPSWPRTWRDHVWSVLIQEGADMLNADDLEDAVMRLSSDS
ncbi:MAG: Altered inheritance of mitochondria protein 6 [Bogoriella megaspora]|nr:MAG: Altered inheritance of mitochondria protein 6 [Bogoriella megaspora]